MQKLTLTTIFFLSLFFTSSWAHKEAQDLVRSSCIHTRYPKLCLRTLSNYAGPADSPLELARAALRVSLAHANRASQYLQSTTKGGARSLSKRQKAALSDCTEQMADSVEELRKSLEEVQHLRAETFRWQMSNAMTWTSAALTDGDTCLDGGNVRPDVKRRVTDVARVTSNALYMINRLGQSGTGKPKPKPNTRSNSNNN